MTNTLPGSIDPVFSTLEPAAVWAHFATLCRIPRQSKAEGGLRDEIQNWALARGLSATVDAAGNLLLRKAASRGMEEAPGVVLQAHLDIVCEKNSDTVHDFSRDPIQPLCRDGWLLAEETTLGETLEGPERSLPALVGNHVACDQLGALLDTLAPRERILLVLRHGLDGGAPRTLQQVGEALGISGERTRQLEARALEQLRAHPLVAALRDALE